MNCPMCGGEVTEMGSLGNRTHYRCRDCGMDSSHLQEKEPAMKGYKVEMKVDGQWVGNLLVFGTKKEAEDFADHLFSHWTLVSEKRVVEVEEDATHTFLAGKLARAS